MGYITIKEAAQRWGISLRTAQQYCIEGRIEGATKFSGTWAIPEDAQKPQNPRKKQEAPVEKILDNLHHKQHKIEIDSFTMSLPMPLLNTPFELGECKKAVDVFSDKDLHKIALCEYYYFTGQAKKASDIAEEYLTSHDLGLRLSSCWIYAYANLALDRIDLAKKALANVNEIVESVDENTPAQFKTLAVFVSVAASVLLHLPIKGEMPSLKDFISTLPSGLRLFALYVQAHFAYLKKEYAASTGIVETALALEEKIYPIPTIYLHLVATMDYMSLRQPEKAREHMLCAWEIAQKDNLIEAFGEHHGLVGGMIESALKNDYPEDFKRIIAITYKFSAGWRKIHNPVTGSNVADNLTTTEFAASMLAARGWSNKEIAVHMGISEHTVKSYIRASLSKLHISQRKDLKNYMLT